MTHLRKAAEAALQALEHSTTHGSLTGAEWVFEEVEAAITALREALAAPVVPPGYALVPEHQQIIEAWTWFDANGDYHLSRNEPADYTMAMQVTPLVAAAPKPKEQT